MKNQIIIIVALFSLLFSSCKTQETAKENVKLAETKQNSQLKKTISISGILRAQGITTYQYGTHTIKDGDKFYALRSDEIEMNNFVEKKVKIIAEKIPDYPVDGGPDYLKVIQIEIVE